MEKQEVMNALEEIKDKVVVSKGDRSYDFQSIIDDIEEVIWQLNANTKDF